MNKIFSTGNVFSCNKKNKGKDKISLIYQAHFGAVYALQRNPSFPKVKCLAHQRKLFSQNILLIAFSHSRGLERQSVVGGYQGKSDYVDQENSEENKVNTFSSILFQLIHGETHRRMLESQ